MARTAPGSAGSAPRTTWPLVQPVGGIDTANAIPGAELRIIPGMGHDLPPGLYDIFVDAILAAATRAKTTA